MKTKGQIVRDWRARQGMSTRDLARLVKTTRQSLENLEADAVDRPRYLPELAKVMGYASSDDLLALLDPPNSGLTAQEPRPPETQGGGPMLTREEQWRLFVAFEQLRPDDRERWLSNIERAALEEMSRQLFEERLKARAFTTEGTVLAAYGAAPPAQAEARTLRDGLITESGLIPSPIKGAQQRSGRRAKKG